MGVIYKITNHVNGKVYVGQTLCTPQKRWREHSCAARSSNWRKTYLHRAMHKYGINNFHLNVIDQAATREELNAKEKYWIGLLGTASSTKGYNLTIGGEGCNYVHPQTGERISAKARARWRDQATRKHYAEKVWTEERRSQFSEMSKAFYASPEGRAAKERMRRAIQVMRQCPHCHETFTGRQWQKHGKCPLAPPKVKVLTKEQRHKFGNAMRGTKRPLEEIARRAAALKKRFQEKPWAIPRPTADGLKRIGEASRKRMSSQEAREEKSRMLKKLRAERHWSPNFSDKTKQRIAQHMREIWAERRANGTATEIVAHMRAGKVA